MTHITSKLADYIATVMKGTIVVTQYDIGFAICNEYGHQLGIIDGTTKNCLFLDSRLIEKRDLHEVEIKKIFLVHKRNNIINSV